MLIHILEKKTKIWNESESCVCVHMYPAVYLHTLVYWDNYVMLRQIKYQLIMSVCMSVS